MQCFRNSTLYFLFVCHHIFSGVSFNVVALVHALIYCCPFLSCFLLFYCGFEFGAFMVRWGFFLVLGFFGVPPPLFGYHIFLALSSYMP